MQGDVLSREQTEGRWQRLKWGLSLGGRAPSPIHSSPRELGFLAFLDHMPNHFPSSPAPWGTFSHWD